MFKFAENLLNNLDQTTQSTVQTALDKSKNTSDGSSSRQSKHTKNKSLNHAVCNKTVGLTELFLNKRE